MIIKKSNYNDYSMQTEGNERTQELIKNHNIVDHISYNNSSDSGTEY